MNKISFFFSKPKIVIVAGQKRKKAKEMILRVLNCCFKTNKNVFVFEADQIDKLSFFVKHSRMPVLVDDEKIKFFEETLSFGINEKSDVFASDIHANGGINFKVNYKGSSVPFWANYSPETDSKEQILPVLAAVCVGIALDLNLVEISQSLK